MSHNSVVVTVGKENPWKNLVVLVSDSEEAFWSFLLKWVSMGLTIYFEQDAALFLHLKICALGTVSPSSTQFGEISSVYPGFSIMIAIGLGGRLTS